MGKTKPNQTKPKLNASASQLILNCRISEHNNKEINLIEHQYIVSAEKLCRAGLGGCHSIQTSNAS